MIRPALDCGNRPGADLFFASYFSGGFSCMGSFSTSELDVGRCESAWAVKYARLDSNHREKCEENAASPESAAKSGALPTREEVRDPELAAVVEAWPTLPSDARRRVVAIVRKAGPTGSPGR